MIGQLVCANGTKSDRTEEDMDMRVMTDLTRRIKGSESNREIW